MKWAPLFIPPSSQIRKLKFEEENAIAQVTQQRWHTQPMWLWDQACSPCHRLSPLLLTHTLQSCCTLILPIHPRLHPVPMLVLLWQAFPTGIHLRVNFCSSLILFGSPPDFLLNLFVNFLILTKFLFFLSVSSTTVGICWEIKWHCIQNLRNLLGCLDHISN